jgi:hypothetical protein
MNGPTLAVWCEQHERHEQVRERRDHDVDLSAEDMQ